MNDLGNRTGVGFLLLAAALALAGCGSDKADLSGAVYRDQIPVYSPASVTEVMGGTSSGPETGLSQSMSWWLTTPHSREKVEAWYDQQIPNAEKMREDWGDGPVVIYKWAPEGGKLGEELTITITKEDIQIAESVQGERKL